MGSGKDAPPELQLEVWPHVQSKRLKLTMRWLDGLFCFFCLLLCLSTGGALPGMPCFGRLSAPAQRSTAQHRAVGLQSLCPNGQERGRYEEAITTFQAKVDKAQPQQFESSEKQLH